MNAYAQKESKAEKDKTGIPAQMKAKFERSSGFSFDDVRVHYNSEKPAQLHAHAYTQGSEVFVAPGQEKHLPHELGHVVQQKSNEVKPTGEVGGMPLNDDEAMESGADKLAEEAESSEEPDEAEDPDKAPLQAKAKDGGVIQKADLHSEGSYNFNAGFMSSLIGGIGVAIGLGSSIYSSHVERKRKYDEDVEKYADAACEAREEQVSALEQSNSPHIGNDDRAKAVAEFTKLRAKIKRNYETAIKKAIKVGALNNENEGEYGFLHRTARFFSSEKRAHDDNNRFNADNLTEDQINTIEELNIRNALIRARKAFTDSENDAIVNLHPIAPPAPGIAGNAPLAHENGAGVHNNQAHDDHPPEGGAQDDHPPEGGAHDDHPPEGGAQDDHPPGGGAHDEQPPEGVAHDEQPPEGGGA